LRNARLKF